MTLCQCQLRVRLCAIAYRMEKIGQKLTSVSDFKLKNVEFPQQNYQLKMNLNQSSFEDPSGWGLINLRQNYDVILQNVLEPEEPSRQQTEDNLIETCLIKMLSCKTQTHHDVKDEKFFKKRLVLKNLLKQQKKKAIIKNFRLKAARGLANSPPIIFQPYQKPAQTFINSLNAISLPVWLNLLFSSIYVLQTMFLLFFFTVALVFGEEQFNQVLQYIQIVGICVYSVEVLFNLIEIQTNKGRRITKIKQIILKYLQKSFILDFTIIFFLCLDLFIISEMMGFFRMIVLLKIGQCLRKLEFIENYFINNFYKEQYWGLIKVFLTNFLYAHCLAILLVAMTYLSQKDSWLHKIEIENQPWFQKYAWSYYWGTTTMLTIGFGDISPSNYKEAVCMTIIETISCILLAYNINCVGTLIHNIRSQNSEKNQSLKTMRRLAKENNISEDLEWKVCNYISESDKMRKKFKFQKDKEFITSLPLQLKGEYLKEANRNMFENLVFFKNLTEKTLLALAEHIEIKIAHPEQIIYRRQQKKQILILRNGIVGYCTRIAGSTYSETVIDKICVQKGNSDKLLHLHFLSFEENINYLIKSLKYSIISLIDVSKAVQIMRKTSAYDFQNFCELRDRSKHVIDEYETIKCDYCQTKHSKMKCPKLHFSPIKQIIIYKELARINIGKNERIFRERSRAYHWHYWKPLYKYQSDLKVMEINLYGKKMVEDSRKKKKRRDMAFNDIFYLDDYIIEEQLQFSTNQLKAPSRRGSFGKVSSQEIFELRKVMERKFSYLLTVNEQKNTNFSQFSFEVDELHDYNYYYTSHNPKNLDVDLRSDEDFYQTLNRKVHTS